MPLLQHIGLPMFAADRKPKRIQQMSLGVLNLPRNALLDWCFGHSLISCHVEHHLFPSLSDNMCLKVSQSLPQRGVGVLLPLHVGCISRTMQTVMISPGVRAGLQWFWLCPSLLPQGMH